MAWIESHQSLATHKKLLSLKAILKISRAAAVGHLHMFWWWCIDNLTDGKLTGIRKEVIAEAADWQGDAAEFFEALVESRFIDRTQDCERVHDWMSYAGRLLHKRKEARERAKRARKPYAQRTRTFPERTANVLPNSTVHNTTKEKTKRNVADTRTQSSDANGHEVVIAQLTEEQKSAMMTELKRMI